MDNKGRTGFAEIPLAHIHHLKILMTTKKEFLCFAFKHRTSATNSEGRLLKKWRGTEWGLHVSSMEQKMQQRVPLIRERMKTPRAASVAGILFSVLLTATVVHRRSYDLDCHYGHSHAHPAAMDNNPRLCPGRVAFAEQSLCWLVGPGISHVGAHTEHIHPG